MTSSVDLSGYHLSFDAEMTTAADGAQFRNTFINGDRTIYVNNEAEYYVDNNQASPTNPFTFANGALTITASPMAAGGLPYTSGLLSTANTFSQNTGYFEIRAKVPSGVGFWPAFWMLTPDYSSEVDILEQPNNDGSNNYYDSVKTSGLNQGAFNNAGVDLSTAYHTYGFMWTPYFIQFTLDGQYTGYAIPTPAGLANAKPYLIANLAVGGYGSWPGQPDTGASAQFSIDYIRAYSSDPNVQAVAQEPISTPDAVTLPGLPSVGSGSDILLLQLNEDAYLGDAQFTVTVDGVQQGGTFTVSASKALQQMQALSIYGEFGSGTHNVYVNFLNDAYGGSATTDRNLYVTQATLNGNNVAGSALALYNAGSQGFTFAGPTIFPPTVVLGSGPDLLALQVAEDAYKGDAQFTITVDGTQIGGTQTVTALKGMGSTQAFDVRGSFGSGAHTATVTFLNDAFGGTATTDRNLYVTQASLDNTSVPASTLNEYDAGSQSFSFQTSTGAAAPTLPTPSILTLHLSEDSYQGDAQFIITVDGKQLGTAQYVSASHAQGGAQAFSFADVLSAGTHDIGVSFINDLWGGTSSTDRNLYVLGADLNQTALSSTAWTASLFSNGAAHFSLVVPS